MPGMTDEDKRASARAGKTSLGKQETITDFRFNKHHIGRLSDSDEQDEDNEQVACDDPLLRRANSALNLLKSLSSGSASSTTSSSDEDQQQEEAGELVSVPQKRKRNNLQDVEQRLKSRGQKKPLTSPTASSTSTGSTGYNSDSRQTRTTDTPTPAGSSHSARVNWPRAEGAEQEEEPIGGRADDEETLEMIELVRGQPTAMRLILEQLRAGQQPKLDQSPVNLHKGAHSTSMNICQPHASDHGYWRDDWPIKSNTVSKCNNEPHYSAPVGPIGLRHPDRSASATFERPD